MQEEMRKDENIYLMGEEVAEYNGAYKVFPVLGRWLMIGIEGTT